MADRGDVASGTPGGNHGGRRCSASCTKRCARSRSALSSRHWGLTIGGSI
jgi:hypothetical protein